jgi:hypothetical protein
MPVRLNAQMAGEGMAAPQRAYERRKKREKIAPWSRAGPYVWLAGLHVRVWAIFTIES